MSDGTEDELVEGIPESTSIKDGPGRVSGAINYLQNFKMLDIMLDVESKSTLFTGFQGYKVT